MPVWRFSRGLAVITVFVSRGGFRAGQAETDLPDGGDVSVEVYVKGTGR